MSHLPCVIVHADMFGSHPSLNEGVERAVRYGIVTSASVTALGDALDDAVKRIRMLPSLDIGVHYVLVNRHGQPLDSRQVVHSWLRGELSNREMAGRLRQQIDKLQRVHSLSLSHIALDTGYFLFPPLMRIVCAIAMEYKIKGVRFQRNPPKKDRLLTRLSEKYVYAYGRRTPDFFYDKMGGMSPVALMSLLRDAAPGITEIVVQPGVDNRLLKQATNQDRDWERELQAVCDESVRVCLRVGNTGLGTWRNL